MKHRIVVVGAGFAGLQLVQDLAGADCDITLIDQRNHHLFLPLLYQVATTLLSTSEIAWPIRRILHNRPDVVTLLARVTGVDRAAHQVLLENGDRVPFDTLVLATGARHAYFGHDEWEADAPGLKTLEDANTIRRRLLLAFERAELSRDPAERDANLTFAIIGRGPDRGRACRHRRRSGASCSAARVPAHRHPHHPDHADRGRLASPAGFSAGAVGLCGCLPAAAGVQVLTGQPVTLDQFDVRSERARPAARVAFRSAIHSAGG